MKRAFPFLIGVCLLIVAVGAEAPKARPVTDLEAKPQTECAACGKKMDKQFFVDHEEFRLYVCGEKCREGVEQHPERAMEFLKARGQAPCLTKEEVAAQEAAGKDPSKCSGCPLSKTGCGPTKK